MQITMSTQNHLLHDLFSCNTNLVCKLCDKYLTVVPIYCVDEIGNVCGRCISKAKEMSKDDAKFHRQFVFEALLKEYSFPCTNKKYGCKFIMKWDDDVLEHESACGFKKEICPLNYEFFDGIDEKCSWTGKTEEFVPHVEAIHKDLIEANPFKLVLKNEGKNVICFNRTEMQFVTIVLKYFKDNVYYFMVMLHGSEEASQCYSVKLKIFDENEKTYLTLSKNSLESLQHLPNCFESNFNEKMFKIDLNSGGMGNWRQFDDMVVLKFKIIKKSISDDLNINKSAASLVNVLGNSESMILKLLQCTKCNLFMTNEIYNCANNHNICGQCKLDNCKICESDIYSRDAYLEKISASTFLCVNKRNGCTFVSKLIAIDNHEKVCKFRKIKCVLLSGCKWTGSLNSLSTHFEEKHNKYIIENDSVMKKILNKTEYEPNRPYANYLNIDCQIFEFGFEVGGENFYFRISRYDYENTQYNFIFRLFHSSQPDICITIPGSCFSDFETNSFEDAFKIDSKTLQIFSSSDLDIVIKIFKVDS